MTKSPHFWWIIGVLSAIIIILTTLIVTHPTIGCEVLIVKISVCSTLLSITLSIFAIQYTYHSNIEVSKQFKEINTAARNINATSKVLSKLSDALNIQIKDILQNVSNIATTQTTILQAVDEIKNGNIDASSTNEINNNKAPVQQVVETSYNDVDIKQQG